MEPFAKLDNLPLRERVYRALQDAIVSGALAPGQRLRDHELAARLGISRTPVREALQRLGDEGLVATAPRSSTRVTPLDARVARDAFPVVAALHALATRHGVPRLARADLDAMRAANERLAGLIAAVEPARVLDAIAADDQFHGVLLAAANNAELAAALQRVMPKVRRLEYAQFSSLRGRASVRQHEAIVVACARRAADEAARLVEENWLGLGHLIAESLEAVPAAAAGAAGRDTASG